MHRLRFGLSGSNIRSTWYVSGYFPLEFTSPEEKAGVSTACLEPTKLPTYVGTVLQATRNREENTPPFEVAGWSK